MSWGTGATVQPGYGDADSWGGPADGVDIMAGIGDAKVKRSAKIPSDTYMFMVVIVALAILWALGGIAFKTARM